MCIKHVRRRKDKVKFARGKLFHRFIHNIISDHYEFHAKLVWFHHRSSKTSTISKLGDYITILFHEAGCIYCKVHSLVA